MSKGSKPRPIDKEAYNKTYDKIFGKRKASSLVSVKEKESNESERTDAEVEGIRREPPSSNS